MKVPMGDIISAVKGGLVTGNPDIEFKGVSTDSRKIAGGEIFIALPGEKFDGHDYVLDTIKKGAAGAIVRRDWLAGLSDSLVAELKETGSLIIEVDDTLKALGDVASYWRRMHPIPVVAITGSNGKTTTKEMVASILSRRYKVLKTEGNLNNLIGLPLMVIRMDDSHEAAVLELGMNRFGEIRRLSEICRPDFSLITNIGSGHLEGVGSIEGVARAKGEILEGTKKDGVFIVNMDDSYVTDMAAGWKGKKVTYALDAHQVNVRTYTVDYKCCYGSGETLSMGIGGKSFDVKISGLGRHNAVNATAAAAVCHAMGFGIEEIISGLEAWSPYPGRFQLIRMENGVNLVDDTYNANPTSVNAALQTLEKMKGYGRGIAFIGDMLELGEQAEQAHYDIGRTAAQYKTDYLFLLGSFSAEKTAEGAIDGGMPQDRVISVASHAEAVERICRIFTGGDWVLVKGSRGMSMEKAVQGIISAVEGGNKV